MSFLPQVAWPPHDPLTLVLDDRLGWRGASVHDVEVTPSCGTLTLSPLTGSGRNLAEPSGSFGGLVLPKHVARLPDCRYLFLNRNDHRLYVFDACCCELVPFPCVRIPESVVSITVIGNELFLCARDDKRVIVLDAETGSARAVWSAPKVESQPGIAAPWTPVASAALPHRMVAVADPANGGVHLCSRYGRVLKFIGGLGAVQALAVDNANHLYVQRDGEPRVLTIDITSGKVIGDAERPDEVASGFPDPGVRVFADGAVDFCCAIFSPTGERLPDDYPDAEPVYPPTGVWLSEPLDSETAECVWDRIELCGSVPPTCSIKVATRTSDSLLTDDELADEQLWRAAGTWKAADPSTDYMLHSPPGRYLWLRLTLSGNAAGTPCIEKISLAFPRISLRRYLPAIFGAEPIAAEFTDRWLAIFDRGLRRIEHEVDYQARLFDPLSAPAAPEVAARKDFLSFIAKWVGVTLVAAWPLARRRRFLKLAPRLYPWRGTIQGMRSSLYLFLGLDRFVDYAPGHAHCVPCVTPVKSSWQPPRLLLEHYKLRRWLALNHARLSDAAKLWGERIVNRSRLESDIDLARTGRSDGAQLGVTQLKTSQDPYRDPFHVYAHRMSVFVPAACGRTPAMAKALEQFIEAEKPAHVEANLVLVEPRFRIGVQSMLGFDAVIGVRTSPVTLNSAPLGKATVLAGHGKLEPRPPRTVGTTRVGVSTIAH